MKLSYIPNDQCALEIECDEGMWFVSVWDQSKEEREFLGNMVFFTKKEAVQFVMDSMDEMETKVLEVMEM